MRTRLVRILVAVIIVSVSFQFFTIPTLGIIEAKADNPNARRPKTIPEDSQTDYLNEVENWLFLPIIHNGKEKLTIWTDVDRFAVMQELAALYEASNYVDVAVESHDNLYDDFISSAPAGYGPDIAIFPHDRVATLYAAGLLSTVDLGEKEDDFVQTALNAMTMEGNLLGLPYGVENLAFFYNTQLVPIPPSSWEELYTMGLALQEDELIHWGFALTGLSYDAYPLMTANGGYVFGKNPDGSWNTDDLGIGGAGMIAFGEQISNWVTAGFMSPDPDWTTTYFSFMSGELPWIMAGPWALNMIRNSGIPYAIQDFPSGIPFLNVQGFVVSAFSDNQALAESFLRDFMADDYPMTRMYEVGQSPPAYIPVLETITDPDMVAFGEIAATAEPMPNIPEMGCVWGPWGNALGYIVNGEKTPTEAYTFAHNEIRDCIDNPLTGMVNVPGSFQNEVGCAEDWDPACDLTALTEDIDGLYHGSFIIPAGSYEVKVALNGTWAENYGAGGVRDGANIPFTVPSTSQVIFTYYPDTHILDITLPRSY